MYRENNSEATPSNYVPTEETTKLRALLFQVLPAEVQEPFHLLEASRSPREWVRRQHEVLQRLAALVPHERFPEGWEIAEPVCHCPACGAVLPRSDDQRDHPVASHIRGVNQPACAVVGELLHWFNTIVRPEKFSDDAVHAAYRELSLAIPPMRGGKARRS